MTWPEESTTSVAPARSTTLRALKPNSGMLRASSAKNVTCSRIAIRFCWASARTGPLAAPSPPGARIS